MKQSCQFIVLNTTKTGESSIVLHTLSSLYGRRSFVTTVAKKPSAMTLFQPLNILEADIWENPKSTLWRATGISALYPLIGIRQSVSKNAMTMFMSEVLYRVLREGSNEDGLYQWCERSILTLDAMESDYGNYHLRFLLELCSALGFSPSAQDIAPFAGEYYEDIARFMQLPFAESMLMPLSGARRNGMADSMIKYLSHHAECQLNIQSLKVLRELFLA